jgi:hypothetical protein
VKNPLDSAASVPGKTAPPARDEPSGFPSVPTFPVDERNLLEARMIVPPYNQHVRPLSSEPFGWFAPPMLSGVVADIVYRIISLKMADRDLSVTA